MEKFVRLTLRFPKVVLGIGLLLTLVSIHLTGKIRIRSNFSDLLPDNHPIILQTRELEKTVGGASSIVVALETKNQKAADLFLTDLRKRIEGMEGIRYIDDRPPTTFLKREALLYLSIKELEDLHDRIRRKIEEGKLRKAGLYISFEEEGELPYSSFLAPNPRHQNPAGTLFVSLIKPDWRNTEVARTELFLEKINGIIGTLNPKKYDPSMEVVLTGPYVKTLSQKKILLRDAALVSTLSFLGSIAYLLFHFRRKRAVFLIGLPLMASVSWSLGVAWLLFGSINLFSSAISAILLGLAADYGIHIYSEYLRHRRLGEGTEQALTLAITHLGRSFITASSTTAAAFFSLTLTRFKALHEFGAIAGCGVLLCAAAFILLFPPLTLLIERWRPQKIVPLEWSEKRQRFSRGWIRFAFSKKNLILSGLFLLLPVLIVATGRPRFDYNMNHILGKQGTKDLDQRVDAIFNHTVNPEVALAQNLNDAGRVSSALRKLRDKNEKTADGTTIKGAFSLKDFVPGRQTEKIAKIHTIRSLFDPRIVRALGEKDRKLYEDLRGLLDPKPIILADLPREITEKFEDREGKLGRMVVIFPNFDISRADRFMRFVEEIREVRCPDCSGPFYASGESTVFYEIVRMLFREGRYVAGFAVLSILAALLINFRSWQKALTVFAPLAVGILATVGWMGLTGIPFNIINLAALPIILGTADDYAVHMFQRYLDHPEQSLDEAYRVTFRPIVGSSVTTLIGFASLLVADMGGIRSFGLLSAVGIFLCTLTTLVWFPAWLARKSRPRHPT